MQRVAGADSQKAEDYCFLLFCLWVFSSLLVSDLVSTLSLAAPKGQQRTVQWRLSASG